MSDLPNPADLDALAGPIGDESLPPVQNTLADLPGQLKEWLGGVAGRMGGWARDAATVVNDFITRRDIADAAAAEAEQFSASVQQFSGGLDEVVRADPTATNMALALAAITVPAIVGDHPYLSEDQRAGVADQLAGDMGRSIARNAVIAWAQRDPDTAQAELKRLGGLFGESDRSALADHVDLLARARAQDQAGAAAQDAVDRLTTSEASRGAYLDQLVDANGQPRIPRGWMMRVANDQRVSPEDTALLQRIQQRMQNLQTQFAGQTPPLTDGTKVGDFLKMAQGGRAEQAQLLEHVGVDLDLRDAQTLMAIGKNPSEASYMNNVFSMARRAVKGPDGDLDPTGEAMGRFAQVFLREYRQLGRGALDPNDPNFLGSLRGFAGRDAMTQRIQTEQKAERLADIFAKRQQMRRQEAQRQVAIMGVREDIAENRRQQAELGRQIERDERAREREYRQALREADRMTRAEFASAAARARLEAANQPSAPLPRVPSGGGAGRVERRPEPTDTFRRFLSLGRPERV